MDESVGGAPDRLQNVDLGRYIQVPGLVVAHVLRGGRSIAGNAATWAFEHVAARWFLLAPVNACVSWRCRLASWVKAPLASC